MKRPTWVTTVGVIGIILACMGFFGAVQTMVMPSVMEFEEEIMAGFQQELEKQGEDTEEAMEIISGMFDVPEWFGSWCMAAGIIGFLVSGFYLFASIFLLQMKSSSLNIFYLSLGICIAFALIKTAAAVSAMSFMGAALVFWSVIGMAVNIILLIVALTGDKSAFRPHGAGHELNGKFH